MKAIRKYAAFILVGAGLLIYLCLAIAYASVLPADDPTLDMRPMPIFAQANETNGETINIAGVVMRIPIGFDWDKELSQDDYLQYRNRLEPNKKINFALNRGKFPFKLEELANATRCDLWAPLFFLKQQRDLTKTLLFKKSWIPAYFILYDFRPDNFYVTVMYNPIDKLGFIEIAKENEGSMMTLSLNGLSIHELFSIARSIQSK